MPLKPIITQGSSMAKKIIIIAVALIVAAAVLTLFSVMLSSNHQLLERKKLNHKLQTIMNIIADDVQRAGYWAHAETNSDNPFMQVNSSDISVNAANDCIIFSYDRNKDGSLSSIDNNIDDDERYGYRLNNGVLQFRPAGAAFDCTAPNQNWSNLTNQSVITIIAFTITLNDTAVDIDAAELGTDTTHYRYINILITGQLTNDTSMTKTITRTIKVYNNQYAP